MQNKIYNLLKKIYGITMSIAFWGGILPLIPFIIAICLGGNVGEKISLFIYKQYYPWIIAIASISIIVGLIAMYAKKINISKIKN